MYYNIMSKTLKHTIVVKDVALLNGAVSLHNFVGTCVLKSKVRSNVQCLNVYTYSECPIK